MLIALFTGCTSSDDGVVPIGPRRPRDETDTTTARTGDTGPDRDSAATGDTGPEIPAFDCDAPWPTAPASFTTLQGYSTAEDFDFSGDGYLVAIHNANLVGKDAYGTVRVVAAGVAANTAGTRVLSNGDFVVANVGAGSLMLVTVATGATTTILSGLDYPNGVEVDADDWVYVAENSAARVRMVHAYTGEQHAVAVGLNQPNGVILSPDGQTLYVGSFGGGIIYAIDRISTTEWAPHRVLYNPPAGDGGFDGINVDICGNVYITEYIRGDVYRISADSTRARQVVSLPSSWIPNMRWGVGVGGWDPDILYVADRDAGRVFAVDVGIPGKPHLLAP